MPPTGLWSAVLLSVVAQPLSAAKKGRRLVDEASVAVQVLLWTLLSSNETQLNVHSTAAEPRALGPPDATIAFAATFAAAAACMAAGLPGEEAPDTKPKVESSRTDAGCDETTRTRVLISFVCRQLSVYCLTRSGDVESLPGLKLEDVILQALKLVELRELESLRVGNLETVHRTCCNFVMLCSAIQPLKSGAVFQGSTLLTRGIASCFQSVCAFMDGSQTSEMLSNLSAALLAACSDSGGAQAARAVASLLHMVVISLDRVIRDVPSPVLHAATRAALLAAMPKQTGGMAWTDWSRAKSVVGAHLRATLPVTTFEFISNARQISTLCVIATSRSTFPLSSHNLSHMLRTPALLLGGPDRVVDQLSMLAYVPCCELLCALMRHRHGFQERLHSLFQCLTAAVKHTIAGPSSCSDSYRLQLFLCDFYCAGCCQRQTAPRMELSCTTMQRRLRVFMLSLLRVTWCAFSDPGERAILQAIPETMSPCGSGEWKILRILVG